MLNLGADSTPAPGARVLRLKVKSIRDPDRPAEMREIPVDDLRVKVANLPGLGAGADTDASDPVPEPHATESHLPDSQATADTKITTTDPDASTLADSLSQLNAHWAFVRSPVAYIERATGELFRRADFLARVEPLTATITRQVGNQSITTTVPLGREWLAWKGRLEVLRIVFEPERPVFVDRCFNLWRPREIEPAPGDPADLDLWHQLTHHLFPDPASRRWIEQWVSHLLFKPRVKLTTALLLAGDQGAGKDVFLRAIAKPLGDAATVILPTTFTRPYTGWLKGKLLVVVSELKDGRTDVTDRLKTLITEPKLEIEEKHKPTFKTDNYCNFAVTSNHAVPLRLADDDRRFAVFRVRSGRFDDRLAGKILSWVETKSGQAALLDYYRRVDRSDFRPHAPAPLNTAKIEITEDARSAAESFAHEIVAEADAGLRQELATRESLLAECDPNGHKRVSEPQLSAALRDAGAATIRPKINGRKIRFWVLARADFWERASASEVRNYFAALPQGDYEDDRQGDAKGAT